ncbi:MAG: hypothetical protein RL637_1250 [Pseudomonadota bacterium]|jgi:RimK family alpha-L-glutamate ligase
MQPTIAIITDDPGWHGQQLVSAFEKLGYRSVYVSLTECCLQPRPSGLPIYLPGFTEQLPTAVFVRGVPGGSLEEVVFYLSVLHALKRCHIPVYNNAVAIERSVDKGMTSFLLHQAGLPTPPAWILRDRTAATEIVKQQLAQGYQMVSKPLFGSQGEGVRRFQKTTDVLWLSSTRGIFYLQQFVDCLSADYSDIRVFVIHHRVIAAMRRCGGKSWLNNVARGALCTPIPVEAELAELAIAATQVLDMDYAGVDIIQTQQGYTIIEVNSVPAWKGLQSVCHFAIADFLAEDLHQRYLLSC